MEAIKLCRLDTPIIFIEARINLSRFVVTGCAAKTSATVTCIQMDTSVNAANQVVSVGADIAFDADPKFFACLVRFESSSVPTTLPTAYDVYPLDGRHDGGY